MDNVKKELVIYLLIGVSLGMMIQWRIIGNCPSYGCYKYPDGVEVCGDYSELRRNSLIPEPPSQDIGYLIPNPIETPPTIYVTQETYTTTTETTETTTTTTFMPSTTLPEKLCGKCLCEVKRPLMELRTHDTPNNVYIDGFEACQRETLKITGLK